MEHSDFATLLKRYRLAAGLTQEELAYRANLSTRGISNLERGTRRTPYLDTVRRLADALDLEGEARSTFEAAGGRMQPVWSHQLEGPHNLPAQLTSFVGRERELAAVAELLRTSRLVTVTGTGGCGKTRLAIQLAMTLLPEYPDGVRLAQFGSISEASLIPDVVAAALDIKERGGRPSVEVLIDALRPRRLLLLLDNCEHLIAACADLVDILLRACPSLTLLATSREPLRISGEIAWRVPPLSLPPPERAVAASEAFASESVHLFCDRAKALAPSFDMTERNAAAVAQICRRLDGIPLAIELAATRVQLLTPEQIESRLDDCFRLLTGGSRTSLPQHQTLEATLDWSHALLADGERVLLRRLAVFAGGFTLEAAEAVGPGAGLDEREILDLLGGLVHRSLVVAEADAEGVMRYRLLEPIRQYARKRLVGEGELANSQEKHATYYKELAERAAPELRGAEQLVWLQLLEREQDNLRAVLAWALQQHRPAMGIQLADSLHRFWYTRGRLSEGYRWLRDLLVSMNAPEDAQAGEDLRARALALVAELATDQGEYEQAAQLGEESLTLYQSLGDPRGEGFVLNVLGTAAAYQGYYQRAETLCTQALDLCRRVGDQWGEGASLNNLGMIAREQGKSERAVALYTESLAIQRDLRDVWGVAFLLNNLAEALCDHGELAEAPWWYEESLALRRRLGDVRGIADTLSALAHLAHRQAAHGRAAGLYEESLTLYTKVGDQSRRAVCLEGLARSFSAQGQHERAARLFATAARLRQTIGHPVSPADRQSYDDEVAHVRAALGEDRFSLAWLAGWTAPTPEVAHEALSAAR